MASTKRDRSSLGLISLALVLFTSLNSVSAVVTPIGSKIPPYTFAGSGNSYQIYLDRYFDFTKAVYPITITAAGLGDKPGYTYIDSFNSVDLDKKLSYKNIKAVTMLDHNNFLVYGDIQGEGNPAFDVVYCGSPKGLDLGCVAKKTVIDKTKIDLSSGYVLEDAKFDPRSGVFITAWRNPEKNMLALYSSDTANDPDKEVVNFTFLDLNTGTKEAPKFAITNRARIEIQSKIDGDKTEFTQVYVFDQKTSLKSDVDFSTTFVAAKLTGSIFQVGSKVVLTPDSKFYLDRDSLEGQIDPKTITSIYEHENQLFIASMRLEEKYKNKLCLSKIQMDEFPYVYNVMLGGLGVVCAPDEGGDFFGPSLNSNIVFFSNNEKSIKVYTLTDTEKDTPVFTEKERFSLKISPIKKDAAIRDIHCGNNSYSLRFVSGKSVDDSGEGSYGVIRSNALDDESYSDKDTIDFVVNQIKLKATMTSVSFYLLEQPFIFFEDNVLETGVEKKVTIIVNDNDNKPAQLEATFTRYDSGSDVIEVNGQTNFQDIEVDVNSKTKHNFGYNFVKYGNNLKFKFDYQATGLSPIETVSTEHKIFTQDRKGFGSYTTFAIDSASAFTFSQETGVVFYKCNPENAFATQCIKNSDNAPRGLKFAQKLKSNKGVSLAVASRTIGDEDKKRTYFYFNWYCHEANTWNYEVYDKPIIDFAQIDTTEGNLFTVIAFNDSIQFAKFFTKWSYGSRSVQVFDKNDVDIDEFCPENIVYNPQEKNTVWIFSSCNRNQNLLTFEIQDDGKLKFKSSRWISSDSVSVRQQVCVLPDEMVLFTSPANPDASGILTSYDREFSFTKQEINTQVFNVAKQLIAFECIPELNIFLILSRDKDDGEKPKYEYQITVFRGSSLQNAMKRVLFSAFPVNNETTSFQTFAHFDRVVIVTFDKDMKILDQLNVDTLSPSLATIGNGIDETMVGQTVPFTVSVSSGGSDDKKITLNGSLKVLDSLKTDPLTIRGAKQDFSATNFDMNLAVKLQSTHIIDCNLYLDEKVVDKDFKIQVTKSENSDYEALDNLTMKVGNYERFERGGMNFIDVVSFYRYSESNALDFGKIQIYENIEDGKIAVRSTLTLPSTFRSVSSISQNNNVYSVILTNEGIASSLKLAVARGTTFSTKVLDIKSYNFFERADIFALPTQSSNGSTKLVVVAYSKYMKTLSAYLLTVDIPSEAPKLNDWTLDVDTDVETTDSGLHISDYDWVDNNDFINFYVISGSESKASRVTYDKKIKEFKYDKTIKPVKFEAEGKKDSVIYSVGCSKSKPFTSKDICAFSTYAAVVYYAEMDNSDENPKTDSLTQQPSGVKVERSLRLRRPGNNFAKYVYVTGQYVVAETERIQNTDTKNALIWDIAKYEDDYKGDFGAMGIVVLTSDKPGEIQSQFDSEIISSFEIIGSQQELQGSYITTLNLSKTDYTYKVSLKRLNIYELEVKEVPQESEFNKLSFRCEAQGAKDQTQVKISLSDVFTWKAPPAPSAESTPAYE